MPLFKESEEVYNILYPFFNRLLEEPTIGPKIVARKVNIRFEYSNPEAILIIDATGNEGQGQILRGDDPRADAVNIEVLMTMSADVAHRFWLGKVNLVVALTKGDMKAKGPIPKIMAMLPIIKNSYAMYKAYLAEIGREDLLQ